LDPTPQVYMSNCTNVTETDHATEKSVAIGGIACAKAIPTNNNNMARGGVGR